MTTLAPPPPPEVETLASMLDLAWTLLARGVVDRHSVFHTPTVATLGLDGRPRARTVVLRACDRKAWRLRFHTDTRSPKAAEVAAAPGVALHVYDPVLRRQVRLEGEARLLTDGPTVDRAWAFSRAASRVCYRQLPAPGVPLDEASDLAFAPGDADGAPPVAGREHFAVVEIDVGLVDHLHLHHAGHRRAVWRRDADGTVSGGWVAP